MQFLSPFAIPPFVPPYSSYFIYLAYTYRDNSYGPTAAEYVIVNGST